MSATLETLIENIVSNNLKYCFICLRTERERKLLKTGILLNYTPLLGPKQKLSLYLSEHVSVLCYVCASKGAALVKFLDAVKFGKEMNQKISTYKTRRQLFMKDLEEEMEERYLKARKISNLMQTNTLFVDSGGIQHVSVPVNTAAVVPKEPPLEQVPTITIIDDDDHDEPKKDLLQTQNTAADTNNTSLVTNSETITLPYSENYMLHPIVQKPDGSIEVPSLNATIVTPNNGVTGYLIPLINTPNIQNLQVNTSNMQLNTQNVGVKTPNKQLNTQNLGVKTPNIQLNTQKIGVKTPNKQLNTIQLNTPKKQSNQKSASDTQTRLIPLNIHSIEKSGDSDILIRDVRSENSEVNNRKRRVTSDSNDEQYKKTVEDLLKDVKFEIEKSINNSSAIDVDHSVVSNSVSMVSNIDAGRIKQPVLQSSRIDWEDKIPMDVISYMDATDPNPDKNIIKSMTNSPKNEKQQNASKATQNFRTAFIDLS